MRQWQRVHSASRTSTSFLSTPSRRSSGMPLAAACGGGQQRATRVSPMRWHRDGPFLLAIAPAGRHPCWPPPLPPGLPLCAPTATWCAAGAGVRVVLLCALQSSRAGTHRVGDHDSRLHVRDDRVPAAPPRHCRQLKHLTAADDLVSAVANPPAVRQRLAPADRAAQPGAAGGNAAGEQRDRPGPPRDLLLHPNRRRSRLLLRPLLRLAELPLAVPAHACSSCGRRNSSKSGGAALIRARGATGYRANASRRAGSGYRAGHEPADLPRCQLIGAFPACRLLGELGDPSVSAMSLRPCAVPSCAGCCWCSS